MSAGDLRCVLNGCERSQGSGTWVNVRGVGQEPVCEEHWQALRTVAWRPPTPPVPPSQPVSAREETR